MGSQSLELPGLDDDDLVLGEMSISDDQALDDFQLYGPGAAVDTQTAAKAEWLQATLDQEGSNFLEFVRAEIARKNEGLAEVGEEEEEEEEEEGDGGRDLASDEGQRRRKSTVSFAEMLPPTMHGKVVAAQAFHHVLALATKGLVGVRQEVGFGNIWIGVVG